MKKLFTTLLVVISVLMLGNIAFGQLLFEDNFNYTSGTLLKNNGYTAHSGVGTNSEYVTTSGLSYTGYASSGIGNAAAFVATGEDVNKTWSSFPNGLTSGSVYAGALIRIDTARGGTGNTGDYFFHLLKNGTTFTGRLYVRKKTTDPTLFSFGIGKSSTAANIAYTDSIYSVGTTYFVTLKYTFITGTTNDTMALWINPVIGSPESAPTLLELSTDKATADMDTIYGVAIRQGGASSGSSGWIDGIRVGTTWESVVAAPASISSDIVAAGNETSNIDYASYQNASITLTTDAVRVWSFTIRDGGGVADGDSYPTILSGVTINKGAGNSVTSWANTIREAALFDGTTKVAEVSVTGESIVFTGLSGAGVTAPDDGSKTLDLYVTFESAVTDNQQFEFQITNANVAVPGFGSSFFSAFTPQLSSIAADANRIEVIASKLAFATQPPATVPQNYAFTSAVEAVDANNNRDLDYVTNIGLSVATGTGILSSVSGLTQTPVSGLASWSDLKYDTPEAGVSILAQSGTLTSATSNTFTVNMVSALSDIVAGVLTIPTDISSLVNTQGAAEAVFDFTVRDGGASAPDADAYATIINTLSVVPGALNTITDWSTYIAGAELFDGLTSLGTGTVAASSISFSGAPLVSVPDNGSTTLTLKIWLKNPLPAGADNKLFQAKINQNANVTVNGSGSMMAAGGADVVGGTGTEVTVLATALQFVGTIPNTSYNTNFTASAKAVDANGNIDADFVATVTFAKASGPGLLSGTTDTAAFAGVASTTNLRFNAGGLYSLSASSAGLTGATSNSFGVAEPALFKAANVPDTLWWDVPSSWVIESGYSITGTPHSKDQVILNHDYNTNKYVVAVGPTYSDSAAQLTIGYPGNPDSIFLVIPYSSSASIASLVYGNAVPGDYDLIIAEKGVVKDSKYSYNKSCLYRAAGDSVWIRSGGLWYHNTNGFNTMLKYMSKKLDGDYGTVEFDVPSVTGMTFDISGGPYYWYPNLVLSNNYNAKTYWYYGSGVTYVKGNLTINPGAKDSMSTASPVIVFGNIINNGIQVATTSQLVFAGTSTQTIGGSNPMDCGSGMIALNASGVDLLNNVNITGGTVQTTGNFTYDPGTGVPLVVPVMGTFNTNANTMSLDPNGSLSEGDLAVIGNVSVTRTANLASNQLFGGIGVEINAAGTAPGVTTVLRKTGVASTGYGNQSIKRYFDISPAVNAGLNATLAFGYSTSELNGLDENTLMLFKSVDGGTTWTGKSGDRNVPMHKITAYGINSFSRWTAGSYNSPLFQAHTITLRNFQDMDGNITTTGDQSPKKWRMSIFQGLPPDTVLIQSQNFNTGVMATPNLEAGDYYVTQNDSTGWLHLGVNIDGTPQAGSINALPVHVAGGVSTDIAFINQKASSLTVLKFRDHDGDAGTTGDQTPMKWGLSIYSETVSPGTLVATADTEQLAITGIQAGKYIVVEQDNGAAWKRINGNQTLSDTLVITGGQDVVDQFVNFKPNSITIRKMKDNDGKIATSNDRVNVPWHLELHHTSATGPLVTSSDNGTISASNLGDDTYVVVESDSTDWIHLGYALNTVNSSSTDNNISVSLSDGANTTFDFVNAPPIYSMKFRGFDPDSIAQSKDLTNHYKPIARKANAVEFKFTLTAPDDVTLTLKFSVASSGVVLKGTDTVGTWTNAKIVTTTVVDSLADVTVLGWGFKGKEVKTGYEWATSPKKTKGNVLSTSYIMNQPRLPMPNRLNALNDAFSYSGFTTGLQVGMDKSSPDSTKLYGWLNSAKYSDASKTLNDKGAIHSAAAHGFDTWISGKIFAKRQKWVSKTKYDNILLAEMIALKLNMVASNMEIVPLGFGELIFDDATLTPPTGAPNLNGMMVKEIASLTDSMMMGWTVVDSVSKRGKPYYSRHFVDPTVFAYLNTAITKINNAFEGTLDTTRFAEGPVKFTGVKPLIDVAYLRANPAAIPAKIIPIYSDKYTAPLEYTLYQNYPNPFNPTTMIQFDLPQDAFVTLKVYNLIGQEVVTLLNHEQMTEGTQEVPFNAQNLSSGVYFYRLVAEGLNADGENSNMFQTVKKMILLK